MNTAKFHILVGTDFSESSTLAIQHAARMAQAMGARLHLAHTPKGEGFVADTNLGMNIPGDFPEAKEARASLQRPPAAWRRRRRRGPRAAGELADGRHAVADQRHQARLRRGRQPRQGLLQRAFLGSVSNQLAGRSPVPVMIIPAPGREEALNQPEPPQEPELPSVGRAVVNSDGGSSAFGIGSVGGGDINYR